VIPNHTLFKKKGCDMIEVKLQEIQDVITNTNGKIFSARFIKKDGQERDILCRLGVKSYIKGTGKPSFALNKDNPYQLVFDLQKKQYRVINMDTLIQVKFNKKTYKAVL